MKKRIISILVIVSILFAVLPVFSVMAESRESNYITNYIALLSAGSSSGELTLTYRIKTTTAGMTRLGVLAIFVYRTDGSLARTIIGSVSNGLMQTSGYTASGTYSFNCEPGESYYCNVTFIAENASGSDVRDRTTNTVVAPL